MNSVITALLMVGVLFLPVVPSALAMGTEYLQVSTENAALGPLNATYWIEHRAVQLVDGYTELAVVQGSTTKSRTKVWGRPEHGDLDGDGEKDAVLILWQDSGGSGTFYEVTKFFQGGSNDAFYKLKTNDGAVFCVACIRLCNSII